MISKEEIQEIATQKQLAMHVVEKDYVLSWVLAGIHQHTAIQHSWIFKGGTCLKKCYFETFRFSEDLDFSYRGEPYEPREEGYKEIFLEIAQWVYDQSGIELPEEGIEFEVFQNPRGTTSVLGKLSYRGPVQPNKNVIRLPRIKIDLTFDEPLILEPVVRSVEHPYSDKPEGGMKILAYSYEEVFAEKTRALVQRLRPRDLYDVIHLYRRLDLNPDHALLKQTLEKKCLVRAVPFPSIHLIENHNNRKMLESEWSNQLRHQLPALPPFEVFLEELPLVLEWLAAGQNDAQAAPSFEDTFQSDEGEVFSSVKSEPIQELSRISSNASLIDKVRFAAANRLLLQVGYQGSLRKVEPYNLIRSSEGDLSLGGMRVDNQEHRYYRIDRIESIEVLEENFSPKFQIEITSDGYLPVHQLTRKPLKKSKAPSFTGRHQMRYVFKCSLCGKQFKRIENNPLLKAHKKPNSKMSCYGTFGIYLRAL